MKKKLCIIAGLAISAVLLWLACRRVDFYSLAVIMRGVRPLPLILVLFTVLSELIIRGVKWSLLLAPSGPARPWDALRLEAAGLALNNVLPLRLGDISRGAFGAEFFRTNIFTVFSTILAEKALDLAALFVLSAAAAEISGVMVIIPGHGLFWALAIAVLAAAAVLFSTNTGHGRFSASLKRFPGLEKTLNSLTLGLKALKSPASAAAIFSLALLQWFMNALNYYWLARAFEIEKTVTVSKSVLLSFTGAAASSAPGMPGYFGSFELAVSAVLAAWGISKETALAYAAASHILSYLIITAAGLFFLYQMEQSLSEIWLKFSDSK
ncbi:MAG: lysylphosphatidylglycerol synthase transmembrane domain-containing protein [Elusimicrobia bacterium]|nr:lysylphosphatidylglycerol synthase transmembrane domain-containing protein [Elusimicrobiota bacterium]